MFVEKIELNLANAVKHCDHPMINYDECLSSMIEFQLNDNRLLFFFFFSLPITS